MLSILIPVYNYDVGGLVSELLDQIQTISCDIEVCLLDDGSTVEWKKQYAFLDDMECVRVIQWDINKGRTASRGALANASRFDYLLFLDCDAAMIKPDFLKTYLEHIPLHPVVVGGHCYQNSMPDRQQRLHWKYGKRIEVRDLHIRKKAPYACFSTFNFAIHRNLFLEIFDGLDVEGYGHEDTLMGFILQKQNIPVHHIDNPALHVGLKSTKAYLQDTRQQLYNAAALASQHPLINIRVINLWKKLNAFGVAPIIKNLLAHLQPLILRNLHSAFPSIFLFQLYKLYLLLEIKAKNQ